MTVIRPNSVSGITSITAQANEINFFRSNGALAGLQLNGVNFNTTTGVSTFNNLDVGGVLTYQDVTNVDSLGIGTFRTGINVSGGQLDVGSNIKLGNAGVITATSFVGSGANLTGIDTDLVSDTTPQLGGDLASNGQDILFANNDKLKFGTGNDAAIYHNDTDFIIDAQDSGATRNIYIDAGTVNEGGIFLRSAAGDTMFKALTDANCFLYYDNDLKYRTTSAGSEFRGDVHFDNHTNTGKDVYWDESENKLNFKDSVKATFGDSGDLEIYHDGTTNYIRSNNGDLVFRDDAIDLKAYSTTDTYISCVNGGAVTLRYDNTVRLTTTSTGVSISGDINVSGYSQNHFAPSANNTYDLGFSSYRWRNIYTNDLNLSNEGGKNKVDGTWGNYTIQEGESDLFLINNRNGKKYKFNLTEVS